MPPATVVDKIYTFGAEHMKLDDSDDEDKKKDKYRY
jgi:hypothetical protein